MQQLECDVANTRRLLNEMIHATADILESEPSGDAMAATAWLAINTALWMCVKPSLLDKIKTDPEFVIDLLPRVAASIMGETQSAVAAHLARKN